MGFGSKYVKLLEFATCSKTVLTFNTNLNLKHFSFISDEIINAFLCCKALPKVLGKSLILTLVIIEDTRNTKNKFRGFVPKLAMIDVFRTLLGFNMYYVISPVISGIEIYPQ